MPKSALLIVIGLLIGSQAAFAACTPVPGADQIWSKKQVHWVFVGEVHGSNETPAAFIDLVCDAVAHGKTVTVALERPTSEQDALTGMLSSHDLSFAEKTLLDQPGWKNGVDGRASRAMLRLLLSLRELHATHPEVSVAAFDSFVRPYQPDKPGARDEAMGHVLLALGEARPEGIILVLTGNFHAMQSPMRGYDLAAMYIPAEERISLEATDTATGDSWTEWNGACGPTKNGVKEIGRTSPRGVYLDPTLAPYGKVDGILALGVPLTASEPADSDPDPLPECRKTFLSAPSTGSQK